MRNTLIIGGKLSELSGQGGGVPAQDPIENIFVSADYPTLAEANDNLRTKYVLADNATDNDASKTNSGFVGTKGMVVLWNGVNNYTVTDQTFWRSDSGKLLMIIPEDLDMQDKAIINLLKLQFNTTAGAPGYSEGVIFYDKVNKCFSSYNDRSAVSLQHGRELHIRCCNNTGVDMPDGRTVYISGVDTDCPEISLAQPDDYNKNRIIGMTTEIVVNGQQGEVTRLGKVRDLVTIAGLTTGNFYLGVDGTMTNTLPTGANFIVHLGIVLVVDDTDPNGIVLFNPIISNHTAEVNSTNGFSDAMRAATTFAFDDVSRTFTLAPTGSVFYYYIDGHQVKVLTSVSKIIDDVEGLHAIYFDDQTGVLSSIANPNPAQVDQLIRLKGFVTYVYWDATNKIHLLKEDERHGISMSPVTHSYLHFTRGAQYLSGLTLGNITADGDGNVDASAQFSTEAGFIADEDLITSTLATTLTEGLPIFYNDGPNGYLRKTAKTGFSVIDDITAGVGSTGRLVWNEYTGATWQLSILPSNNYMLLHIFAINAYDDADAKIAILGQAAYGNITAARAGAATEIASIRSALSIEEKVPVATVTYQTADAYSNAVKARIRTTASGGDYVNWLETELAQGAAPASHSNLTNKGFDVAGHGVGFAGFQRGTTQSASDPLVTSDSSLGYRAGDLWVNTATKIMHSCVDATVDAAVWTQGGISSVVSDASLTGDGTTGDPLAVALTQALTSLSVGAQTSLINGLLQRIGGTMVLSSDTGTQVKAGTSVIQLLNDGAITLATAASLISLLSGTTIDLEAVDAASLSSSGGSTTIGAAVALLLKNGVSTIATVDASGVVINQGTLRSAIPSRTVLAAAATGALTDLGGNVDMNYAAANVFTLPNQATAAIPVGGEIQISMLGAGQTSIAVEAGDLLVSANLMVDILAQYRSVVARKFDATTWILTGDLKF